MVVVCPLRGRVYGNKNLPDEEGTERIDPGFPHESFATRNKNLPDEEGTIFSSAWKPTIQR